MKTMVQRMRDSLEFDCNDRIVAIEEATEYGTAFRFECEDCYAAEVACPIGEVENSTDIFFVPGRGKFFEVQFDHDGNLLLVKRLHQP